MFAPVPAAIRVASTAPVPTVLNTPMLPPVVVASTIGASTSTFLVAPIPVAPSRSTLSPAVTSTVPLTSSTASIPPALALRVAVPAIESSASAITLSTVILSAHPRLHYCQYLLWMYHLPG